MANETLTFSQDLIVPEIFAGEIQKQMGEVSLMPLAEVTDYAGRAGNLNITKRAYLGDAVVVGEGEAVPFKKLEESKVPVSFKKYALGVEISDEAEINAFENPINVASESIANSLDSSLDKLLYTTLSEAKITTSIVGISKKTILEALKLMKGFKNKKKYIVVNTNNYANIQQIYKATDDKELFDSIAGTEIFTSEQLSDEDLFIVQAGGLKLGYSKSPKVEKDRNLGNLTVEIVGSTIAGAWITDDKKVIKVTVLPEIEDLEL